MSQASESFFPSLKKEEFFPLLKSFAFFFFVLASWYALRPVRNEMAIQGGIFNLPYILLAIVIVMGLINPVYSWLVSKIKTSRIVIYCYSFFILNLIIFLLCWSFFGEVGRQWTGRAFYIWCNVYSFFVVSIFWVTVISVSQVSIYSRPYVLISSSRVRFLCAYQKSPLTQKVSGGFRLRTKTYITPNHEPPAVVSGNQGSPGAGRRRRRGGGAPS